MYCSFFAIENEGSGVIAGDNDVSEGNYLILFGQKFTKFHYIVPKQLLEMR